MRPIKERNPQAKARKPVWKHSVSFGAVPPMSLGTTSPFGKERHVLQGEQGGLGSVPYSQKPGEVFVESEARGMPSWSHAHSADRETKAWASEEA